GGVWMHCRWALHDAVLHLLMGVQAVMAACVCPDWPTPPMVSQPAVVQLLPSVSVQAVLGAFGVCTHWPGGLSDAGVLSLVGGPGEAVGGGGGEGGGAGGWERGEGRMWWGGGVGGRRGGVWVWR